MDDVELRVCDRLRQEFPFAASDLVARQVAFWRGLLASALRDPDRLAEAVERQARLALSAHGEVSFARVRPPQD